MFINKECSQRFPNYPKIGACIPKDSANVGGKILLLLFGEKWGEKWKINWKMYFHSVLWLGLSKEITIDFYPALSQEHCCWQLCSKTGLHFAISWGLPLSPTEGKSWPGRFLPDASGVQATVVTVTSPLFPEITFFLGGRGWVAT